MLPALAARLIPVARRARLGAWLGVALVASIAGAALAACEGTSIGNPPGVVSADIQLGLEGQSGIVVRGGALPDGGSEEGGGDDGGGAVKLDEVWLAFHDAGLHAAGTCSADGPATAIAAGPFAAELVSGRVLPARPSWSRPADEGYCALDMSLAGASAPVAGAPAELAGTTLFARGKRADGVPFVARVAAPMELAIKARGGSFSLGIGSVGMVLVFDFDDWFEHLPLDQAKVEGGQILIDDTHNQALLPAIVASVPPSARLFRDADRDGVYEPHEGKDELGE
jgi:hypothetical protein